MQLCIKVRFNWVFLQNFYALNPMITRLLFPEKHTADREGSLRDRSETGGRCGE